MTKTDYMEPMAPRYICKRRLEIYPRFEPTAPIRIEGDNLEVRYETIEGKSALIVTRDNSFEQTIVTVFFLKSVFRIDDTFSLERVDG